MMRIQTADLLISKPKRLSGTPLQLGYACPTVDRYNVKDIAHGIFIVIPTLTDLCLPLPKFFMVLTTAALSLLLSIIPHTLNFPEGESCGTFKTASDEADYDL